MLLDQNGHVDWKHAAKGPISALWAHNSGNGRPCIFTGTEYGEVIAFLTTGQLIWRQQVSDKRVMRIRVASSGHEDCVVIAISDGTVAVYSLEGSSEWKQADKSSLADMCCMDINGDGEDEIIVGTLLIFTATAVRERTIWTTSLGSRLASFDCLAYTTRVMSATCLHRLCRNDP